MKFKASIDIDQPQQLVADLFANPEHLGEYQDGFIKKELINGKAGEEGAVSKMYYKFGKGQMEITETVVSNQLPNSFEGHYHHKHMDNTLITTFTALSDTQTRYEAKGEYTRISWVMPKLMAILFPGMFRKQVYKWMENFKAFAEKQ